MTLLVISGEATNITNDENQALMKHGIDSPNIAYM